MKDFDKVSAFESDDKVILNKSDTYDRSRFRKSDFSSEFDNKTNRSSQSRRSSSENYNDYSSEKAKRFTKYENKHANKALIFGFLGFIPGIGFLFALIAIFSGIKGFSFARKNPDAEGKIKSIIGIVLGWIGLSNSFGDIFNLLKVFISSI